MHAPIELKRLKHKQKRLKKEAFQYNDRKYSRMRYYLLFTALLPLFLSIHLILMASYLFQRKRYSPLVYRYIKFYFTLYYYFLGIKPYSVLPIPKTFKKATVIFTIKPFELTAPLLCTFFPSRAAFPTPKNLGQFPINHYLPILRFGQFSRSLGYPEKPLPRSLKDIEYYSKKNIPVIVYLHPGFMNPMSTEDLQIHSSVFDLLDSNIDCYFLRCKDIETIKRSTFSFKHPVGIFCESSTDLFDILEPNASREKKAELIKDFFHFRTARII